MGSLFTVPHLPSSVPTWQNQPGRLNQSDPKDPSFEKEDFVRFVAQESMPIGLSPREIERESDDPELASVRHYVQTGDWSQCSMPGYTCVENELCIIGKLVLRGDRIVIPQSLRKVVGVGS